VGAKNFAKGGSFTPRWWRQGRSLREKKKWSMKRKEHPNEEGERDANGQGAQALTATIETGKRVKPASCQLKVISSKEGNRGRGGRGGVRNQKGRCHLIGKKMLSMKGLFAPTLRNCCHVLNKYTNRR